MATAVEIAKFLDKELHLHDFEDSSCNGLQVENSGNIKKIAFAVDACLETFQKAVENNCQMLIVHHGLIWYGLKNLTGINYEKAKYLIENNLALYAAHLPLDAHPKYGNNVQLAKLLSLQNLWPFGAPKKEIGVVGRRETTRIKVKEILHQNRIKTQSLDFGNEKIRTIAICSGGAASHLVYAIKKGADLFITGEPLHYVYHQAKEAKVNVIFGGHYETEVWGVRALMPLLKDSFKVQTVFIDLPTLI